jgi:predicted CoA-substrate-specific enzyme activase
MRVAGIDVGSRSIDIVVLENGEIKEEHTAHTGFSPRVRYRELLSGIDYTHVVSTGYGRKLVSEDTGGKSITEIQAYALGARHLFPLCRTVLDIGGQDTKAIALNEKGAVVKFEMNDRCAAGTGKFLEFMATAFQRDIADFGAFALEGAPGITINSMCTVFAETEATSLMARGGRPEDIARALHYSVVQRSVSMLRRVSSETPLLFAGGVARNPCIVEILREFMGTKILKPEKPEMVGALGAALYGEQYYLRI